MKKIALRDWHNAIVKIYEVDDNYDLSILEKINDSIHSIEEISDLEIQELYEELDFSELSCTDENINFIIRSKLEWLYDWYFWF